MTVTVYIDKVYARAATSAPMLAVSRLVETHGAVLTPAAETPEDKRLCAFTATGAASEDALAADLGNCPWVGEIAWDGKTSKDLVQEKALAPVFKAAKKKGRVNKTFVERGFVPTEKPAAKAKPGPKAKQERGA